MIESIKSIHDLLTKYLFKTDRDYGNIKHYYKWYGKHDYDLIVVFECGIFDVFINNGHKNKYNKYLYQLKNINELEELFIIFDFETI